MVWYGILYCTTERATSLKTQKEAEDGHCCDAVGQHVLASEVQAWSLSYVRALVLQEPGKGEAQEERARELSRVGTDGEQRLLWEGVGGGIRSLYCVELCSLGCRMFLLYYLPL